MRGKNRTAHRNDALNPNASDEELSDSYIKGRSGTTIQVPPQMPMPMNSFLSSP
eukprot:CAMPEP_0201977206 /NCGR_PEP_ID=MMETSP0904-20121228/59881_1 /ASSEMBLY_ACC=CAM_ASM_000553 /TAXON_ID=420261 /ORGANISM="Thalassiosira antarctica, Strain CCMP982" /LENGTH=53 /DNA_ID=CAMNT_0048528523 /DNA_START=659 /DNA_END=816 /DNA_ORIENTATION=+